jgi:hypothetical protein
MALDLRESSNRPSPVAKFIHRAESNVLAKAASHNNLRRYRTNAFSAAAYFAKRFRRLMYSGAKGAPIARA